MHQDKSITKGCGVDELLLYGGENSKDRVAFQRYLADVQRGKTLLQLMAVNDAMTPFIRESWSARTFTAVETSEGRFDEIVCNISYHFNKHGSKFYTIERMTQAAIAYFRRNRTAAKLRPDGLLKFPDGSIYEPDGRIVTFISGETKK